MPTDCHKLLCRRLQLGVGGSPFARCWPQETGKGRALNNPQHIIAFGVKGGADISGVLAPLGRRVELEAKTGNARQNNNQKAFQKMITRFGGIYMVVHAQRAADIDAAVLSTVAHLRQLAIEGGWKEDVDNVVTGP